MSCFKPLVSSNQSFYLTKFHFLCCSLSYVNYMVFSFTMLTVYLTLFSSLKSNFCNPFQDQTPLKSTPSLYHLPFQFIVMSFPELNSLLSSSFQIPHSFPASKYCRIEPVSPFCGKFSEYARVIRCFSSELQESITFPKSDANFSSLLKTSWKAACISSGYFCSSIIFCSSYCAGKIIKASV